VLTIGRLLQNIGLFSKRALLKRRYSAKETDNFKEPTNCSHPIDEIVSIYMYKGDVHIFTRESLNMCVYIHIYMCIYVYTHLHICVYVCLQRFVEYIYTHICGCAYTYMHISICMYTHIYTYMWMCIYTHRWELLHVCLHRLVEYISSNPCTTRYCEYVFL